jgi:hypothetical protein
MIDGRRGAGFAFEAPNRGAVARRVIVENLERDFATELEVFGAVHHTHATFTEFCEDTVVGDDLAKHQRAPESGIFSAKANIYPETQAIGEYQQDNHDLMSVDL